MAEPASSWPTGWYVAEAARRLGRRPRRVRRLGLDLVLWRDESGRPACLPAACPHRGADLSLGRVVGGCLRCPYHGFVFGPTGRCIGVPCDGAGPIPRGLRADPLPVAETAGLVWLWSGPGRPPSPPQWFDGLDPGAPVATVTDVYPCHLTRFMENALDVSHFAQLHHRLLPFVGSVVEIDQASSVGDAIAVAGRLLPAPGEQGRRSSGYRIEARFPALVRLETLGLELLVSACPVDADRTFVTARYYQPRAGSKAVARAVSWLAAQLDLQTAQRQDKRVLRTIVPLVGSPRANTLVRADRPISLWYRRWERGPEEDPDVGADGVEAEGRSEA